ncbi:MAG: hypothetical protein V4519_03110 [Patescibacteria group bacterium]
MDNQNVRLAISFIAGLIVGFGGYWLVAQQQGDIIDRTEQSNTTASTTALVMQGDNGVAVSNQAAGKTVKIDNVVLKNPGWVAIHDNNNGVPGRILGAQVFDFGKSSGTVELLRATVASTSYIAVLHNDDGNYKNFNLRTDLPLKDNAGAMVMTTFTTLSQ